MMPKTATIGDGAEEEWSTLVNWKENPAIRQNRDEAARRCFVSTKNVIGLLPRATR